MKWYASYTGVGEYDLISGKNREDRMAELGFSTEEQDELYHLKLMQEYPNFKAAKKSIMEGIECDIGDLKIALYTLRSRRAKE
jgi:hypothetical protein